MELTLTEGSWSPAVPCYTPDIIEKFLQQCRILIAEIISLQAIRQLELEPSQLIHTSV